MADRHDQCTATTYREWKIIGGMAHVEERCVFGLPAAMEALTAAVAPFAAEMARSIRRNNSAVLEWRINGYQLALYLVVPENRDEDVHLGNVWPVYER